MKDRKHLEIFERVIELVKEIVDKNLDPFQVDIVELFNKLRPYIPVLKETDELLLDARAVYELSRLILTQENWIKLRASLLYIDPLLALLRIESMSLRELAEAFVESWHPIIEMEQLTNDNLRVAIEYWRKLPPLEERRLETKMIEDKGRGINEEELLKMGFMSKEEFNKTLIRTWEDLKSKGVDKVNYWSYICSETYEETVKKAHILSFLANYGYISIETDPIKDEIFIIPFKERMKMTKGKVRSVAIPITFERWLMERNRVGRGN